MAHFSLVALALLAGSCFASPTQRIIGGQPTSVDRYPSMVQVEFYFHQINFWGQSCGASIITNRHVLSAAHCFNFYDDGSYNPSRRRIRAGATFRNTGGVLYNVEREFNHPTYAQAARFDGDITVVRLASTIVFTPVIQQVPILSQGSVVPDNATVVHAGWGTTANQGVPSEVLQDVTIYTVNNAECRRRYQTVFQDVTENMICAGILDVGGRDACQMDSGGPMFHNGVLVGVISWGHYCALPFFPGVSARVASYTNWIVATAV